MSAAYEHPSLSMRVTPEQRERAEHWLQEAYADGRIDEDEFDRRIGQVLSSENRKELNEAFYGLVQVPMSSHALSVHSAYQPLAKQGMPSQGERAVAGVAHFAPFFMLWLIAPGAVYALSSTGSYARREAAKAFNFQLISLILLVVTGAIGSMIPGDGDPVLGLMFVGWLVLTIIGGVKALKGEDWRNPVQRVVKLKVLNEKK
ncbi:MAG TPA: DUF1707 and DUF4870 domain-containing protein [Dermatophilaceae bacterium]|nr:DUF1707 and DUF4870 domain-containing protein [Dermatophilaceae bacterium]